MPADPNEPIDLRALDPDADPRAEDRFISAVMARVAETPGRYPVVVDPLWGIWSLARPIAVAAGLVIVVSLSAWFATPRQRPAPETVAEALGVPTDLGRLVPVAPDGGIR